MAKKVYYSKPLKFFWKQLYGTQKKFTPEFTDEQIYFVLKKNLLSIPLAHDETQESRGLMVSGLELWREDSKGELLHMFFLDEGLRTFLETTPLSDLDGIKKFLFENGQTREVIHLYSNENRETIVYKFALHIPFEGEGYAFSLSIENDGSLELYYSLGENGGRMSDKFYADVIKKDDEISKTHSNMFRLVINTIAYMNCFPDCVTDGVPKDYFDYSENKLAKNLTFQVSEKIKESENVPLSKIPHFRKGHFRRLQSDYFTNKKGQMVFVAETMVKGKAKTISMSENIDEFHPNTKKN
ncbi:hypothetical protein [Sphingobacterium chuzhouense]|uniref:Uncharacterized protein n=1 Tax=Sphingobacterium chuzhouense TaxID=1742264 RepID=A0ABR7XT11_9SPHI|nr:hypothetical protein [Sphingobacterium chuzhouense]MBD1422320.1 hypothetical protein [Sphingobacterium chuzhouense]